MGATTVPSRLLYGPVLRGKDLRLFRYAMRSVAVTLAREASFHTDDFETSRSAGCDGFTLAMRQVFPGRRRDAWIGVSERGEQRLEVLGHLE
ncbi:hypothetical protein [Ralstonia pseudosolanacearum]|uniref:hypothetical protein n=1 Tax=Ralstonia pseudosolanacearum TaxID=1310165 RepID=UPI00387E3B80